jgi:hypothetical protein
LLVAVGVAVMRGVAAVLADTDALCLVKLLVVAQIQKVNYQLLAEQHIQLP